VQTPPSVIKLQEVPPVHAWHAWPPAPQRELLSAMLLMHCPAEQQPAGQLLGLQAPPSQLEPLHAPQEPPLEPGLHA
jgi:hypothetical protein